MPSPATLTNTPEYSVSEISGALKKTIEDAYGYVRVRGEITGCKKHSSGHCYFDLKDERAVLAAVCWKGTFAKMTFAVENGLEVIATGKLTTYGNQSKYQLTVDRMEPAGVGALLAQLEARKKALAAEGLFDPERKRPLPAMPHTIGVVTSPTGAVIRDILHRLSDRFPVHVLVWPVRVQGETAAAEISSAIAGFNALPEDGPIPHGSPPRPDLLIVARGGGSLEDLWPFNEEIVVRAAAASGIPLISAVGHETDTTLIDYASDRRAPTPTAAAEMAVPVLAQCRLTLREFSLRAGRALTGSLSHHRRHVEGLSRGLPRLDMLLAGMRQRFDDLSERLPHAPARRIDSARRELSALSRRLTPHLLERRHDDRRLLEAGVALRRAVTTRFDRERAHLRGLVRLFESVNVASVQKRGFAYVTAAGHAVSSAAAFPARATLHFHDGEVDVDRADGLPPAIKPPAVKRVKPRPDESRQPKLF